MTLAETTNHGKCLIAFEREKIMTICKHNKEDNQGQGPFKDDAESHQSNENVDECGNDIKKD